MGAFDKFMDDIVEREEGAQRRRKVLSERERDEEHPQRRRARLHQELPQNRVRWGNK